jgi:hypothetical protein
MSSKEIRLDIQEKIRNNEPPKVFAVLLALCDQISEAITLGTKLQLETNYVDRVVLVMQQVIKMVSEVEVMGIVAEALNKLFPIVIKSLEAGKNGLIAEEDLSKILYCLDLTLQKVCQVDEDSGLENCLIYRRVW